MLNAYSKLTAQNRITVPAAVREALGLGPGALLEWIEQGGRIVVRRAARHDALAVHHALFPKSPPALPAPSVEALKDGIRARMRQRYVHDERK